MTQGRVDQITEPRALRNHSDRLALLEQPAPGQFHFFLPIAPAPDPTDLLPSDDLSTLFTGGWLNTTLPDSSYSPLRYRVYPAGKVEIVGAIKGGAVPSVCGVLPRQFWPRNDEVVDVVSPDGTQSMSLAVSASTGEVTVLAITGGPGSGPATTDRATYSDSGAIAGGNQRGMQWSYDGGADETPLLNVTNPGSPVVVKSGVYAITFVAEAHGNAAGKAFGLVVDVNNAVAGFAAANFPLTSADPFTRAFGSVHITWYAAAGDTLDATILNGDTGSQTFDYLMYVQKVT